MPPNTNQDKLNTLKYWHTEEFFLPQELQSPKKIKQLEKLTSEIGTLETTLSEIINLSKKNNPKYRWEYTIYGGVYPIDNIRKKIEEAIPSTKDNSFSERPPTGMGATYAISFTSNFKYVSDSFQLSTAPWAIKNTLRRGGFSHFEYKEFEKLVDDLKKKLNDLSEDDEYNFMEFLKTVDTLLKDKVGDDLVDYESKKYFQFIAVNRKVNDSYNKNKKEDKNNDMLNSFYINDLGKAIEDISKNKLNPLVLEYLETKKHPKRIDVRKEESIDKVIYPMLRPDNLPDGCWATSGGYPLVYSQQFAINAITQRLKKDTVGLYSVNGSPGTGKTTMLRDLIAHIITERAKVLASFKNPKDMFLSRKMAWKTDENKQYYWELNEKIKGFEIIVASSNNGAVENVTMEIPALNSVDEKWLDKMNYFRELGSRVIGADAWGLASAKLGNASNKQSFISNFMNNKNEYKDVYNEETKKTERVISNTLQGMLSLLEQENTAPKKILWEQSKRDFETALIRVSEIKKRISDEFKKVETFTEEYWEFDKQLEKERVREKNTLKQQEEIVAKQEKQEDITAKLARSIANLHTDIETTKVSLKKLKSNEEKIKNELLDWYNKKPSWFEEIIIDTIRSLFGKEKEFDRWSKRRNTLEDRENDIHHNISTEIKKIHNKEDEIKSGQAKHYRNHQALNDIKRNLVRIEEELENTKTLCLTLDKKKEVSKQNYLLAVEKTEQLEGRIENEEEREKSSPWTNDITLQEARTNLFIQAMNFHKATIKENSKEIRENLFRMREVLSGAIAKKTSYEPIVADVWTTLFLCVPVISTTFASFGNLFGHLKSKKLGWLLIDEAGQATAKASIGAMMRVNRAVVVGDPLQLEPIVGLPATVQEAIRKDFNAPDDTLSEHTSVQKRADYAEKYGTYLEFDTESVWVGSPLRVHRRCHSPMFEISNITTYKGLMIQGKPEDTSSLEPSKWVDVKASSNNGHWIEQEGEKAREIINYLNKKGVNNNEIYLISPFRDVVNGLYRMFGYGNQRIKVGTIHTVQGKEAKIVILVLGSDPKNDGARVWASSKPNLLNVASTRAIERLYIVGDKDNWKNKKYFNDAVRLLDANVRKVRGK